jgi:hypothetical protein
MRAFMHARGRPTIESLVPKIQYLDQFCAIGIELASPCCSLAATAALFFATGVENCHSGLISGTALRLRGVCFEIEERGMYASVRWYLGDEWKAFLEIGVLAWRRHHVCESRASRVRVTCAHTFSGTHHGCIDGKVKECELMTPTWKGQRV